MFRSSFSSFIFWRWTKQKKMNVFFFCFRLNSPNSQKLGSFVHLLKTLPLALHLTLNPSLARTQSQMVLIISKTIFVSTKQKRSVVFFCFFGKRWTKKKMNETWEDELFLWFFFWTKMNEEKDERNPEAWYQQRMLWP